MKKMFGLLIVFIALVSTSAYSASGGVAFTFFFPDKGEFGEPLSLSLNNIGFNLVGEYVGINTGISLYNINGMGIKGLPFELSQPGMGPFLSLKVPLVLKLSVPISIVTLEANGGGFAFYNFGMRLTRAFDYTMQSYLNYAALSTDLKFNNGIGFGWMAGGAINVKVQEKLTVGVSCHYLNGGLPLNLTGTYTGGPSGGTVTSTTLNTNTYKNAYLDYTGLEFSLGVSYEI